MDDEEKFFNQIVDKLSKQEQFVKSGRMMSSPGLNYKKKFFAFYYKKEIVLKLGKDFDPKIVGIKKYRHLNPFKTKAPMKNWYQIPFSEKKNWQKLSKLGLEFIKSESK